MVPPLMTIGGADQEVGMAVVVDIAHRQIAATLHMFLSTYERGIRIRQLE